MKRYGQVIGINSEKIEEYKKLHKQIWPEISQLIYDCNIRNYSIYLKDNFLFSYYEYIGSDYNADMAKMAESPINLKWWGVCEPCQAPLPTRKNGEWWSDMEEVFHQE